MKKSKGKKRQAQTLITIIATEILNGSHKTHNPETFYKVARKKIHKMHPETMGRLAAQTKAHKKDPQRSILAVHQEKDLLNCMSSGRELLRILAATAIAIECMNLVEDTRSCA